MNFKKWLLGGAEFTAPLANGGLTLLRVFAGLALAFGHGIRKFPPSEKFIESVGDLGFPLPTLFAWTATCSEFFCGLLLALGLLTRPAALFILFTMMVAAFLRHAGEPFSERELAFVYGSIALAFLFIGSGRYGMDALLRRQKLEHSNT